MISEQDTVMHVKLLLAAWWEVNEVLGTHTTEWQYDSLPIKHHKSSYQPVSLRGTVACPYGRVVPGFDTHCLGADCFVYIGLYLAKKVTMERVFLGCVFFLQIKPFQQID